MNVQKCQQCGKLFQHILGAAICPECKQKLENDYKKAKDYVYEHPGITIPQLAEELEIDRKLIKQWLREDRLQLSDEAVSLELTCEHCGKPITSGRFCMDCKIQNSNAVKQLNPEKKPLTPSRPKMNGPSKMRFF